MPQSVNGIGTGYAGKQNITTRRDRCASCGRYGDLRSYDTGLYFIFFFIPLIPLGRRRIIDQCPHCRVHRAANLKEWETKKREETERVLQVATDAPENADAAIEAAEILVGFQDYRAFERIAPLLQQIHSGNADVLAVIAAGWEAFDRLDEAEALYRRCLEIDDTEEMREALAVNLIRQGRPVEASELLEHAIRGSDPQKVGHLLVLVEAWQAEGEHARALELLEQCAARAPELKSDKDFQKAERLSRKHLHTGKRIRSERLGAAKQSFNEGRKSTGLIARLAGPVIAVVVLLGYLYVCYDAGANRQAWLVNGLDRPYEVVVAGQRVGVTPERAVPIDLREGTIPVRVLDASLNIPDQTVEIRTPFFARPFLKRTYVINPDQVAIIAREEHLYLPDDRTPTDEEIAGTEYELYVNRPLHEFRDIDYPFEAAPPSLETEVKGIIRKYRLSVETQFAGYLELTVLGSVAGQDVALETARKRLAIDDADQYALQYLFMQLAPGEMLAFLRPGLTARPVRVEWHRIYQETMAKAQPEHDLAAEYRALLEKEPDSHALAYLAGRATLDPDAAHEYLLRSIGEPDPSAYGYGALGFHHCACGEYEEALPYIEKALELDPGDESYLVRRMQCHLGLGNYDEALKWAEDQRRRSPDVPMFLEYVVLMNAAAGDEAQAQKEVDLLLAKLEGEIHVSQRDQLQMVRDYYAAVIEYGKGNVDPLMDMYLEEPSDMRGLVALLVHGRYDEAEKLLEMEGLQETKNEFLVYLAVVQAGQTDRAAAHFDEGVRLLAEEGSEERCFADALAGKQPVDPARITRLPIEPEEKAILLAALGVRYPEHRPAMFAMARKLNCDVMPPKRFLDRLLNGYE